MTKRELEAEVERLTIYLNACSQAHVTLEKGIKDALQLKEWPDFYKLYGPGMFATGVVRLLHEEVNKLREGCTNKPSRKRKVINQGN